MWKAERSLARHRLSVREDSEAPITFSELGALAWEAANEKARHLEKINESCGELHEAVKSACRWAAYRRWSPLTPKPGQAV